LVAVQNWNSAASTFAFALRQSAATAALGTLSTQGRVIATSTPWTLFAGVAGYYSFELSEPATVELTISSDTTDSISATVVGQDSREIDAGWFAQPGPSTSSIPVALNAGPHVVRVASAAVPRTGIVLTIAIREPG
jgi:hypothetical protein